MKGKRAALAAVTTLVGAAALIYSGVAPGTPPAPRAALTLPQAPPTEQVVVGRVIDGDSFVVTDGRRVRPMVLDSCERNTPAGPRATADARALLQGRVVTLVREPGAPDADRYRRLLRYVTLPDGRDFAEVMLAHDHTGLYLGRSDASRARLERGAAADVDRRDCTR